MSDSKLIQLSYYDPQAKTRLTAYADTIVMDRDGKDSVITAIRFGGYPEMVRAMSDAFTAAAPLRPSATAQSGRSKASPKVTGGSWPMTAFTPPPR